MPDQRPPVWRMVKAAVENLGGRATTGEVKDWIRHRYPGVNENTINCQIVSCTVNAQARVNYPQNQAPRLASSQHDFLFRVARGGVELYDPQRHGRWEIRRDAAGELMVSQASPPKHVVSAPFIETPGGPRALLEAGMVPSRDEFLRGVAAFEERERRDAMYKVASFLVMHFWGKPGDMANGLGVLLLTWNQAFYRYGAFDFDRLENCIADNLQQLGGFRSRDISTLTVDDEAKIKQLFDQFIEALRVEARKPARRSRVAAAKALHLLAPGFFPLWDDKIASAYGYFYGPDPAEQYVSFSRKIKEFANHVEQFMSRSDKTVVKLIDEYNYSKYTQGWV